MNNWKEHDAFIRESVNSMKTEEMAEVIGCSTYELHLYMHRNFIFPESTIKRNLALEVIKMRFVHPQYFRPTRGFFKAVGMTQRRWWKVFKGLSTLKEDEYRRLVIHLQIELKDALDARQLTIFEN